jgi:hypothetical protein
MHTTVVRRNERGAGMAGKVYIAGRYSRRDEFRIYAKALSNFGISCTSTWLLEQEPLNSQMGDHSVEFYTKTAIIDLRDVDRADSVLFFSEDPLVGTPRGGRHVEFGYALHAGKQIYVIGPKENIFHYIKEIINVPTMVDFIQLYTQGAYEVTTA